MNILLTFLLKKNYNNHQVYQPVHTLHLDYTSVDGTGQIQTNKQDGYLYLTK
jgi:hypothetical protein